MKITELDYILPEELIAQTAVEPRDHSRLLVMDRSDQTLADRHFFNLPEYLYSGDVLVLNDTKVIPARIMFHKSTGGKIEGLFLRELSPGRWEMMFKGMAKLKTGMEIGMTDSDLRFFVGERLSAKTFELKTDENLSAVAFFERFGQIPLPPYIHREQARAEDRQRYQTVFSRQPGAVAAPTAGLHFTPELLEKIKNMGVQVVTVTLHVGMGTFEPVTVDEIEQHPIHSEWYRITAETADVINTARGRKKKITSVGTTSVRVLETAGADGAIGEGEGWTKIFIYPPYRFKIVDQLVTNFHLPRTTLLAMIFALAGREFTLEAYQHAVEERYRFFSYGDAMLIR